MRTYCLICLILFCTADWAVASANNNGDVCYAKRNQQWLWQQMKLPARLGSRCIIYNGNFVPVYEGRVGICIKGVTCGAEPRNVHIGKHP